MKSFKNIVEVSDPQTIKKVFTHAEDFWTEYYIYTEFSGFPYFPTMHKHEGNTLYLQYLQGECIYGIPHEHWPLLGHTLAAFHNLTYNPKTQTALLHYDTNLHNYIFLDGKIYMVDFSDVTLGNPLSDVYSVMLFVAEALESEELRVFYKRFIELYAGEVCFAFTEDGELLKREMKRFEERRRMRNKE